jgi:hypothetical protein
MTNCYNHIFKLGIFFNKQILVGSDTDDLFSKSRSTALYPEKHDS